MAKITAFRAIRPAAGIAERFAALPYDVYDRKEAKAEVQREPLSFLGIDRPETQFDDSMDMYAPQVYQKAHDMLWERKKNGDLIQDEKPCYYIYELTMKGRVQTGLVACASVDDYLNEVIRRHENTREEKEQDRIRHVDICNAQTGPIFLAYRMDPVIRECLNRGKEEAPLFDFISPDGIRHRGWRISREEEIERIRRAFEKIPRIYIADGHHRAASAVKVSLKRREQAAGENSGDRQEREHPYDSFLSVLFADEELCIMDYNRVTADLNGLSAKEFLERISEIYEVQLLSEKDSQNRSGGEGGSNQPECGEDSQIRPRRKGELGMYLLGNWYRLKLRKEYENADPVEGLDTSILQKYVLSPVFGICDPRTDQRISFVGGIRGLKELKERADAGGGAAFVMYPTSMKELFDVADAGRLMPPKSTWFEPKLRSGLFIHSLLEDGQKHS